ncbi:MAG: hypothetical protein JWO20_3294 [Candidatus Angelobacter sp.]|jgi:hypothetical protein|nr:hypothetical protein [Candidatus Angelobacter sp.]
MGMAAISPHINGRTKSAMVLTTMKSNQKIFFLSK